MIKSNNKYMKDYKAKKIEGTKGDVVSADKKGSWFYSDVVKEHFFKPQNFLEGELESTQYNAMGRVGSPACGDELKVWIFVNPKTEKIEKFWWKTFGCASAIAATSITSVIVTENGGMTLDKARELKPQEIMARLGGLPPRKFHCSVLSDKALREAINDYYRRSEQFDKIEPEASRIIDPVSRVTDKDIEKAVLDGLYTFDEIRERTKVNLDDPSIAEEVGQLLRFYREKYFANK